MSIFYVTTAHGERVDIAADRFTAAESGNCSFYTDSDQVAFFTSPLSIVKAPDPIPPVVPPTP